MLLRQEEWDLALEYHLIEVNNLNIELQKKIKYIPVFNIIIILTFAFVVYFKYETNRMHFLKYGLKMTTYMILINLPIIIIDFVKINMPYVLHEVISFVGIYCTMYVISCCFIKYQEETIKK